jgi:hypothetical protein
MADRPNLGEIIVLVEIALTVAGAEGPPLLLGEHGQPGQSPAGVEGRRLPYCCTQATVFSSPVATSGARYSSLVICPGATCTTISVAARTRPK